MDINDVKKDPEPDNRSSPTVANPFASNKAAYLVIVGIIIVLFLLFNNRDDESGKAVVTQSLKPIDQPAKATAVTPTPTAKAPEPTPTPVPIPTFKVGDNVTSGKFDVVVSDYKTSALIKTKYDTEKTDNQFVIVSVKITNKDDRARDIGKSLFTLVDESGKTYDPYDKMIIDDSYLSYETINPGISRTRSVIFETPKDISVAKLRVDSGIALASKGNVDIDLNAK